MQKNEYHPIPQPNEISVREKEDAMGAYLMMFASAGIGLPLPIINLIAALIYYFVNKDKGRFVRFNTLQSFFSQIPVTILNLIAIIWVINIIVNNGIFTDYFKAYVAMAILANLIYFAFSIVGAVKSHKGRFYYFWFFGKYAFHITYLKREEDENENSLVNKPPKL